MEQNVSPQVLVTGATGFLGSHAADLLTSKGYTVTCLVRDPGRLRWLEGKNVRLVQGDCCDPSSLAGAVRDASFVVHAAGVTKALRRSEYHAVNTGGTENLLRACGEQGRAIKRFVLVSSRAAAGPDGLDRPVSDYGWSKLRAEEAAFRFQDRFPVTILRPTALYGPRDSDVFQLFRMAAKGLLLEISGPERFLQWCHVADAAAAVVLALEQRGSGGRAYCIAEERAYSLTEFRQALLRSGGVQARVVRVPRFAAAGFALAAELAGRLRGRPTIMNRQKVHEAAQPGWTCDTGPASRDLGFRAALPLEQGLAMTWAWYRQQGWLR